MKVEDEDNNGKRVTYFVCDSMDGVEFWDGRMPPKIGILGGLRALDLHLYEELLILPDDLGQFYEIW